MFRLTHTDLKPENILFTSSDWEISYNARKRKDVRKVKSTEVTILNKKKMTGETPEVRSDKRKPRKKIERKREKKERTERKRKKKRERERKRENREKRERKSREKEEKR